MLVRMVQAGASPQLRIEVGAHFHENDLDSYNVLAEIPGTDAVLRDEVVLVGAGLDPSHAATGATDNADGVTSNVSLFTHLPYDPIKSFVPIIDVGSGALALCVNPAVPATNLKEFVAYAKSHPGELNYGSPGVGGLHHLAMELLKLNTHIDLKHVPYRGSAGAAQDIVGGHVIGGFLSLSIAAPLARNNSLRILGIASHGRVPSNPELPTLAEQGIEGVEAELWFALMAPAGTPYEIITRYNTAINEIVREPQVIDRAGKQGVVTRGGTPDQLAEFLMRDIATWRAVVKEAGIKAE
jgi:tripartite-type tricarboxylate transporter receptor subunit TctC